MVTRWSLESLLIDNFPYVEKKLYNDTVNGVQVEINIHQFFKGYEDGRFYKDGSPEMLKLKDWPPQTDFENRLPRHGAEFLVTLPYKDYTDPKKGILNLATKLPQKAIKPDLGPKTYIAYGLRRELCKGNSVTKLHCDMADAVRFFFSIGIVLLNGLVKNF